VKEKEKEKNAQNYLQIFSLVYLKNPTKINEQQTPKRREKNKHHGLPNSTPSIRFL
jgi:hypothetical protein